MRRLAIPDIDPMARFRQQVPALEDFDQDDEEREERDDEEPEVEEPLYEQVGLATREQEQRELGEPDPRSTCFGCIYMGERDTGAMNQEDLVELMDMVVKSIGQTDEVTLVKEVARRYRGIRDKTNRSLLPGERPLPDWSPSTILDHFRWHHCDPEFHLWLGLKDVREAKAVALEAMVVCNTPTKRRRIDKDQVRAYTDLVKLEWQLAKIDPSKCTFYSAGKRLDVEGISKGPMALSFKPMAKMFKKGNYK